jgi:hypothetical protein
MNWLFTSSLHSRKLQKNVFAQKEQIQCFASWKGDLLPIIIKENGVSFSAATSGDPQSAQSMEAAGKPIYATRL